MINNDSKSSYLKGLSKDKLGIIKNLDEEMLEQLEQQNLNNEKKDEIIKEDNKKIQESLIKEDNKKEKMKIIEEDIIEEKKVNNEVGDKKTKIIKLKEIDIKEEKEKNIIKNKKTEPKDEQEKIEKINKNTLSGNKILNNSISNIGMNKNNLFFYKKSFRKKMIEHMTTQTETMKEIKTQLKEMNVKLNEQLQLLNDNCEKRFKQITKIMSFMTLLLLFVLLFVLIILFSLVYLFHYLH
mgnify:CR=1 FL=1